MVVVLAGVMLIALRVSETAAAVVDTVDAVARLGRLGEEVQWLLVDCRSTAGRLRAIGRR